MPDSSLNTKFCTLGLFFVQSSPSSSLEVTSSEVLDSSAFEPSLSDTAGKPVVFALPLSFWSIDCPLWQMVPPRVIAPLPWALEPLLRLWAPLPPHVLTLPREVVVTFPLPRVSCLPHVVVVAFCFEIEIFLPEKSFSGSESASEYYTVVELSDPIS